MSSQIPHDESTDDTTSSPDWIGNEPVDKYPDEEDDADQDEGDEVDTSQEDPSRSRPTFTARFSVFVMLLGVLIAAGIATFRPAPLAAAGILLVFMLAGLIRTPGTPDSALEVSYAVDPQHPRLADTVTVTVTVEHVGERTLTDIRFVDTVPDALQVVHGSPRASGPLHPGETLTIEYTVTARRGTYTFGPLVARNRSLVGAIWTEQPITPDSDATLRCAVQADEIPLEDRATHLIGGLLADAGGEGIEFYSTREYHRGDSPTRINWRELAKRGELNTITYRQHQAAEITLILDGRPWTRVNAGGSSPAGTTLSAYAAYQLTATLIREGHYVGVTVPGLAPRTGRGDAGSFPYRRIEPRRTSEQERLVFELMDELETAMETGEMVPDEIDPLRPPGEGSLVNGGDGGTIFDTPKLTVGSFTHDLASWGSASTQFIMVSPLLDDGAYTLCVQLRNMGFAVVVISPDPTTTPTPTAETDAPPIRMARLQRATRVEALRHQDITVIDWDPATPLSVCCQKQTLAGDGS